MLKFLKPISVIPIADFLEIHIESPTQFSYFILCKTGVFLQLFLVYHRIFKEHIQCRVRSILFDRKNSRHIGKSHIRLVF